VETYSSSPHFFEALDIPRAAKGMLPRASRTRAGLDAEVLEDVGETGRRRKPAARTGTHHAPATRADDGDPLSRVPPRSRPRRRVRAGASVSAEAPAAEPASGGDAAPRRRRRGGRGRGGGAGAAAGTPAEG
jgi:hypothetical protein